MLLSTAYLPPVQYFTKMLSGSVVVEQWESFHKQTYRNRCVIDSPQGLLTLTVPVEKPENGSRLTKDLLISDHGNWRHQHWNALVSSYYNSPFFEYYQDDFRPFYEKKYKFLLDYNQEQLHLLLSLMELDVEVKLSESFEAEVEQDFRNVISPKEPWQNDPSFAPAPYYQVFQAQHGFLPNLSAVDLLFNLGPESAIILQRSLSALP